MANPPFPAHIWRLRGNLAWPIQLTCTSWDTKGQISMANPPNMHIELWIHRAVQHGNMPFGPTGPCCPPSKSQLPAFGPYRSNPFLFMYLSKCFLNVAIEPASTTFSGSSFHTHTTLCVKRLPLRSILNLSPLTLNLCPLVYNFPSQGKRLCVFILSMPLMIFDIPHSPTFQGGNLEHLEETDADMVENVQVPKAGIEPRSLTL